MTKRYDTYKDSGVAWIGKIPSEWNLERLQALTTEINEKNSPIKTNYVLSLTIKDGVIPYEEKGDMGNKSKDNHEEYKLAYPSTIVLNSMNILIGAVGLCNYFGCVSPVYYVFRNNEKSNLHFINYILSSQPFQRYLRKFANGILEIRLRISSNDILKRHIPTPPLEEQTAIATFLDTKCSEIDSLISLQEEMISELQAYKQSVITEAVTKGLDSDVKMKDSGVEWIGEIPEGWNISAMKHNVVISNGSDPKTEGDIPVYGSGASSFKTCGEYKEGPTVLIGRKGATLHIPHYIEGKYWNVDTAFDVKCKKNYNLMYYYYVAMCLDYKYFMLQTTLPGMSQSNYNSMNIPVPPLSEQQQIASYLDTKTSQIDSVIRLKQEKIQELKDYKKSIIYEYVTGKKKV